MGDDGISCIYDQLPDDELDGGLRMGSGDKLMTIFDNFQCGLTGRSLTRLLQEQLKTCGVNYVCN